MNDFHAEIGGAGLNHFVGSISSGRAARKCRRADRQMVIVAANADFALHAIVIGRHVGIVQRPIFARAVVLSVL